MTTTSPMIERITLYKLLDEHCTDEARATAKHELLAGLAAIKGVRHVRAGLPSDDASRRSWDVGVVTSFDDQATADRVMASQDWKAVILDNVGARSVVTKGWTFEMSAD